MGLWRKPAGADRCSARSRAGALWLVVAVLLAVALGFPGPALSVEGGVAHWHSASAEADGWSGPTDAGGTDRSVAGERCCSLAGTCAVDLPPAAVEVGRVLAAARLSMSLGERDPPGPAYPHFKPPRLRTRA